jgi:hypothetical protein
VENNSNQGPQGGNSGGGGQGGSGGGPRRRRYRSNRPAGQGNNNNNPSGPQQNNGNAPVQQRSAPQQDNRPNDNRNRDHRPNENRPQHQNQNSNQNQNRSRRPNGRVLTSNQVLVKYDNLLEQHLITRKKYYEYFNRVDERQLYRLEKNFYDSIEHLRRFEDTLEPWQRETLEKRKTERYRLDLTYSGNHELDPGPGPIEVAPDEIEDPHFKESQKEAYVEYKEDDEESMGTYEDYLKLKGLN